MMRTLDDNAMRLVLQILARGQEMSLATLRPDGYPQATTLNYASRGLTLYAAIGLGSQKAHNIQEHKQVSLTISPPAQPGSEIQALSIGGLASFVKGEEHTVDVSARLLQRYPQFRHVLSGTQGHPWGGIVFLRIDPQVVSLLDYTKGFGHTELFKVQDIAVPA
ncbi:pyridoxamine 5'-phosphate oxidase family protein [Pseudoduganella aquatica]|uniref:Pyridoxamine 5'-phosphate oxidase family protein n=1 Tax=Pseudoduganella aquatica TaxID=2660641 RepID=A0A7X4H7T2_9BURK|nr:pyridoxamine 5'-phosphate oxidase family protein [Pseudoduganella aquatica]MYN06241.1 pyridoxamine 5'-phosphate oxidase family protein [Pseudoduganella aquatica]